MPELVIETNIPRSKIPADFISKAVPLLAQTVNRDKEVGPPHALTIRRFHVVARLALTRRGLGSFKGPARVLTPLRVKARKEIDYVLKSRTSYTMVAVHPDVLMSFGGSDAPTAIARVVVIDRLGPEENKKYCKVLFEFIEKELGVPQDRMFITFEEKLATDMGFRGTTLATIL
ncbi:Macrophage migration inhibitory factor [Eumeta japonica]|uniref:L-dopachrome isomerase n=1 Tax=Eumeta variegata TaxID=151549 RepID=A0A4C1XSK9_EUMVA|nr:Macrophage migration inhibitory factor [Eumeta japonica]